MAINPEEIDVTTVDKLDDLTLALGTFFAHTNLNGKLGKASINQLATFLAPYITAIGGSGFLATTGTVLPSASAGKFTIVGAGTFTQTTGGNVVTTELINILGSSATTWSLVKAIPLPANIMLKTDLQTSIIPALTNPDIKPARTVGSGIIANTGGTFSVNALYDSIIIPLTKNTGYNISGYTKSAGTAMGIYTSDGAGGYTLKSASSADMYLFNWFGLSNTLLSLPTADTRNVNGTFVSPNVDGLFLIINTRFQASDTYPTLSVNQLPLTNPSPRPETRSISSIFGTPYRSLSIAMNTDPSFVPALASIISSNSSKTISNKNLVVTSNIIRNWGVRANQYTGITSDTGVTPAFWDSVTFPVPAKTLLSISGDTVGGGTIANAQNYMFSRLVNGIHVPIPDAELTNFTNPKGATTDKAFVKNANWATKTFFTPDISDMYFTINTRYNTLNNENTLQVELAPNPTSYEKGGGFILSDILGLGLPKNTGAESTVAKSQYEGKTIFFFGDSITQNNSFQDVATALGLATFINYGLGGSTVKRVYNIMSGTVGYDTGVQYPLPVYSNADAISIMIGHNDGAAANTIGTIADVRTGAFSSYPDTFIGNLGRCIEFALSQKSTLKIYLCTLHHTDRESYNRSIILSAAIEQVAQWYGTPVIDVLGRSGINKANMPLTTTDNTHLTLFGYSKLFNSLVLGLKYS